MSNSAKRNHAVEDLDRREMELFRRIVNAGVKLGVPAALHYCCAHTVAVPGWLARAALELLCDLLKREVSKKRGRSAGSVDRYRQDMIDMMRWNEVCVLREKQKLAHESIAMYAGTSVASSRRFAEEVERAEWFGHSLSRIFECVSDVLEKTEAFGSPETIKRSYRVVENNFRDPVEALRYHIFDPNFLKTVGINHDLGYGKGAKIAAWRQKVRPHAKTPQRRRSREDVSRVTYR